MVQDTYKRVQFYGKVAEGGNDSRVVVTHHASLDNIVDAITVSARVYIDPYSPQCGIVSKTNSPGFADGWVLEYLNVSPTYIRCFLFGVFTAGVVLCYSASTVNEKGWYHVTCTFDRTLGTENLKIFQNSVRLATANKNTAFTGNVLDVIIGAITTSDYMMRGYISEVQVYNRALTEDEINYAYLHPNNPKRRGLVMSLVQTSIDKPAAGTWRDVSPQTGNNGTITNATTSKYPAISAGRNALFFPTAAGSDRVDCGNGASLNPTLTGTITGECWVRMPNYLSSVYIMLMEKCTGVTGWQLLTGPNYVYVYSDVGIAILGVTTPDLKDGTWKHIVFTFTAGAATGEIYINGVNKTSVRTARALSNSATNLYVGNRSSFNLAPISGYIAAARVYNRILTAAEVKYNYAHPNNPIRRGLVLNLSQESLYGTQWQDLSGNANHGTITGAIAKNIADSLTGD